MPDVYLLLGGNLGDRLAFLKQARTSLANQVGSIKANSKFYETAAWGKTDQPSFLNQVLHVQTNLLPEELLHIIQSIEQTLGRERFEHWGARVIDIDILFYDDLVLQTQRLSIPHPHLHTRRFTLAPLAEIAPDLVHPVLHKTIKALLAACQDELEVTVFKNSGW